MINYMSPLWWIRWWHKIWKQRIVTNLSRLTYLTKGSEIRSWSWWKIKLRNSSAKRRQMSLLAWTIMTNSSLPQEFLQINWQIWLTVKRVVLRLRVIIMFYVPPPNSTKYITGIRTVEQCPSNSFHSRINMFLRQAALEITIWNHKAPPQLTIIISRAYSKAIITLSPSLYLKDALPKPEARNCTVKTRWAIMVWTIIKET